MPETTVHETSSVAETEEVAAALVRALQGGTCIALNGDLGAGKTQFVRGLVAGLGGDPRQVSSPTYVLVHLYGDASHGDHDATTPRFAMRLPVYHLDAYRASGGDELESIGFSELLDQDGIVVVEWADRVVDLLPPERIDVRIRAIGEGVREIRVTRSDVIRE